MVSQDLSKVIHPETSRFFWIRMIIGFILVVAGVILTILGTIFFNWLWFIIGVAIIIIGITILYFLREKWYSLTGEKPVTQKNTSVNVKV